MMGVIPAEAGIQGNTLRTRCSGFRLAPE